jgi:uncharacterized protein YbjT (DUF2867 family)
MLRSLVERLPAMITPRWVTTRTQPIAADDVIRYLADCIEVEATTGLELDIGGPEVLTYREMMTRFAAVEGKRRLILGVRCARADAATVVVLGELCDAGASFGGEAAN